MMKEPCVHYWLIEPANGPTSRGECIYCHEVREFYNTFPEGPRNPFTNIEDELNFATAYEGEYYARQGEMQTVP